MSTDDNCATGHTALRRAGQSQGAGMTATSIPQTIEACQQLVRELQARMAELQKALNQLNKRGARV